MSDVVVRADQACRTFGSGAAAIVAVHGVACEVRAGDRIALAGPSGSGKTTLLHLLAGLDRPTTGRIEWPALEGRPLRPGPVAVVFQAPSLLPALDVAENVALPLLLQGIDAAEAARRSAAALAHLDLLDLAAKLPEEISGGQAQRVAVARALTGRPQLVLADEPTGQLDHVNAVIVIESLLAAADVAGAALVVNTHDRRVAERLDVRWVMSSGRLHTAAAAPC